MPTGRPTDRSVQVEYDKVSISIPRSTYEKNGYKPEFDRLPVENEYGAAQERRWAMPKGPKGELRPAL